MNRLQKKCVIATASFHLLLLAILFVGPAFFWAREKPDTSPVLEMISPNLVDTASTGVQSPQPPPPAPQVLAQPPTPPQPQIVTPPAPQPVPDKVEPVKPVDLTPVVKPEPVKPAPPKQISLVPVIHNVPKTPVTPAKPTPDNSKDINTALTALRKNLSPKTTISMPAGDSSAAASNYAQVVKSIYEQAWILPDDMSSDTANTKVRVTISSDGTVVSAKIITPSGDAKLDTSVQRTLERVTFIAPFPSGTTDTERTYIINFNPQIKRMLG